MINNFNLMGKIIDINDKFIILEINKDYFEITYSKEFEEIRPFVLKGQNVIIKGKLVNKINKIELKGENFTFLGKEVKLWNQT